MKDLARPLRRRKRATMHELRDLSHRKANLEEVFLLLTEEVSDAFDG